MQRMYEQFLDPDLYTNAWVASFIENLNEPELDDISDQHVLYLSEEMMPTDDIYGLLQSLHRSAQEKIKTTGSLSPEFVAFPKMNSSIKFSSALPQTLQQVENFLSAAKCLSLVRCCQCMFFSAMQPVVDGEPVFAKEADDHCDWGLLTIGSSIRGNCFAMLSEITAGNTFSFQVLKDKITREQKQEYPYSRFFHIADYQEMERVVSQIPKFIHKTDLDERDGLVNFSTTLKALQRFGYNN